MTADLWFVGIASSVVGGLIVGAAGWFFEIRRSHRKHEKRIGELEEIVEAMALTIPESQAAEAFRIRILQWAGDEER